MPDHRPPPSRSSRQPSLVATLVKQTSTYALLFGLMVVVAFGVVAAQAHADASVPAGGKPPMLKLEAGEQLAHPVVNGPLGPFASAQIWLTQPGSVDEAPYRGKVAVRDAGGKVQTYALPAPDETEALFMMKVRAVMFRNVDGDPARELIVLYSSTRIGPQQPVEYGACVYQWNGQAFVRLAAVEQRLAGVRNAAEVAARLAGDGPRDKTGGKP